jgi:hypothetical protein
MGVTIRDIMTKVTTGIIVRRSTPSGVTAMITSTMASSAGGSIDETSGMTGPGYTWTNRGTYRMPVVIAHTSGTSAMG